MAKEILDSKNKPQNFKTSEPQKIFEILGFEILNFYIEKCNVQIVII